MYGFYRIASAAPKLKIADTKYNTGEIKKQIEQAEEQQCTAVVFPELAITGYTCADLFNSSRLLNSAENQLLELCNFTKNKNICVLLGVPLSKNGKLYNCTAVINNGEIKGIVPKVHIPNYREFYEARWFTSGLNTSGTLTLSKNIKIPFGDRLLFQIDKYFIFGIEICEDLWTVIPPSSLHATAGATVIFNPSASNELVTKASYRKSLISSQSAKCIAAYAYASSGVHESTSDLLYGGHLIISENGTLLNENKRFQRESEIITADIDCERIYNTRFTETGYKNISMPENYRTIEIEEIKNPLQKLNRYIPSHPFVPSNNAERNEHCKEIFDIQKHALASRMSHTGIKKLVLGISGGLDSTLALLVCVEAMKTLQLPAENIITLTMPGFGTTDRTLANALDLCKLFQTDLRKIDIIKACLQHFSDIGHDISVHDVTYENTQARERTQLLMDIANKEGGLVIGTGDLSEIALGWSTYNGDHMSMYAVNCSVPKTLIRYLITWVADHSSTQLANTLKDIINTPVSPELLPKNEKGHIEQKTEDIIGPYELHDFFLYHHLKYGATPEKILFIAQKAFKDKYENTFIANCLDIFIRRFFNNQFKRNCVPDGPKVGTISLSPRGDWRMPSDASYTIWKKD